MVNNIYSDYNFQHEGTSHRVYTRSRHRDKTKIYALYCSMNVSYVTYVAYVFACQRLVMFVQE